MNPYLFTNPSIGTAYQNDPRTAYAQALMQQGGSTAPVLSWGEGLARALGGALGGLQAGQVRQGYQDQDQQYQKGLTAALQGKDVLESLQNSGQPQLQQLALETRVKQALNPADDPLVKVYDPNTKAEKYIKQSQAAGLQADAPTEAKAPQTREIQRGGLKVYQQFNPATGAFDDVSSGPAYAPPQPTAPPEVIRLLQQAGIDPKSPQGVAAIAHALGTDQQPKTPELTNLVGPDGSSMSLDKTTPEGAAKLRDLLSKGYTERQSGGVTINNMNEDQAKNTQLFARSQQQLKIATDNWDELGKIQNQAAANVPGGNFIVSDKYQQASAAVKDIAASYLYSVSGATANPGEVANLVDTIVPKPGDSTTTINEKKQRLTDMVNSIQLRMKPGMAVPILPGTTVNNVVTPGATPPAPKDPASMSDDDLLKALQQ